MFADPHFALIAVAAGVLGIFAELTWMGKVLPGVAGGVLLLVGLASLARVGMPGVGFTAAVLIPLAGISLYLLRIAARARRNKRVI
ncbi:MAG: hypothetical protein WDO18_04890 [Acidobacteriota bacterium]